jgi:hypothetical protein
MGPISCAKNGGINQAGLSHPPNGGDKDSLTDGCDRGGQCYMMSLQPAYVWLIVA